MDPTPATVAEISSTSTLTPTRIIFPPPSHRDQAHEECIYNLALTSKHLITASRDQSVRVWDLSTQHLAYAPLKGHTGSALSIGVLESQDLIFTGGVDGIVIIWQLSTGKRITTIRPQAEASSVLSLAVSSTFLVAAHKAKIARVWHMRDLLPLPAPDADADWEGNETAVLDEHAAAVIVALISRDDAFVVTSSGDRTIKVWETGTWTCVRTVAGHTKGVACLAWLGEKLVSGSSDDTIRVWDLRTGVEEACLQGHSNLVRCICVAEVEGEELIVSGSYDESVVVWGRTGGLDIGDVDEGDRTWEIKKRFSPADMLGEEKQDEQARVFKLICDGKRIYAASQAKMVVAWDLSEPSNAVGKVEEIGREL
jgi:WD40 repeat protein